jgi:hypothetical protein
VQCTFSECHCMISNSSLFASMSLCALSINWRVITTLGFVMVEKVVVGLVWSMRCGVDEDLIALLLADSRCDDSWESLCIDVCLRWWSLWKSIGGLK